MGTRADFYVGIGKTAEWIGSIAWDGYPKGVDDDGPRIFKAVTEEDYREAVAGFLAAREDATAPAHGWPWPWDDSNTTDFAYCFEDGETHFFSFGERVPAQYRAALLTEKGDLWEEWQERDSGGKESEFPNMSDRKNFTLGKRSGLLVIGG